MDRRSQKKDKRVQRDEIYFVIHQIIIVLRCAQDKMEENAFFKWIMGFFCVLLSNEAWEKYRTSRAPRSPSGISDIYVWFVELHRFVMTGLCVFNWHCDISRWRKYDNMTEWHQLSESVCGGRWYGTDWWKVNTKWGQMTRKIYPDA